MRPLWDTKQAAEYLGIKEATLQMWRRLGRGPAYIQVGRGFIRYDPASVFAWIEKNTVGEKPVAEAQDVNDPGD